MKSTTPSVAYVALTILHREPQTRTRTPSLVELTDHDPKLQCLSFNPISTSVRQVLADDPKQL
ncbi:hypothetical protein BDW75DRAFT_210732 [Aspergillus navahoensis]